MKKRNNSGIKCVAIGASVVFGLTLIVGATLNLPVSAQGLVTGRNEIIIGQLVDQVEPQALVQATIDAGMLPANSLDREQAGQIDQRNREVRRQGVRKNRDRRRQSRQDRRRQERRWANGGNERFQVNDELIEPLERMNPEAIVQAVVDAGLISDAEAERLLDQ